MFIANVDYLMSFMIENLGDQMTKVTDRFQKPTKLVMADVEVDPFGEQFRCWSKHTK